MRKQKVYISGKITGLPIDEAKTNFQDAENRLREKGYEVINPFNNGLPDNSTWMEHMKADIKLLMECEIICLLNNWRDSTGAKIEWNLAKEMGYKVITV